MATYFAITNQFCDAREGGLGQAHAMSIAFVSGASRGLGREVARGLVAAGHQVIGISKDSQRAHEAAAELGITIETADLQDISQTRALAEKLLAKIGRAHV